MPFLELLVDINVAQIVKISMVGVHVLHHLVGVAPNCRAGICPDQGLDQDPGFGPHLVLPRVVVVVVEARRRPIQIIALPHTAWIVKGTT